jgi:hypothetical protein
VVPQPLPVKTGDRGLRTARVPTVVPAVKSSVAIVAAGMWHPFALSSYDTTSKVWNNDGQVWATETPTVAMCLRW